MTTGYSFELTAQRYSEEERMQTDSLHVYFLLFPN